LPEFLRNSKALGSVAPTDVRGGHRITAAVAGLLPTRPGVKPDGLGRIESALNGNFESFLNTGRKFPVRVGGSWFEASVKATLGTPVDEAAAISHTKTKVDMTAQSGNATSTIRTAGKAQDVGLGLGVTSSVGPYGSVAGKVPLARPVQTSSTTTSTTDQRIIRSGEGSVRATVPVTYTVTLTDSRGNQVGNPITVPDADVTLQIPDDFDAMTSPAPGSEVATLPAGWGTKLEHPVPEAVVDIDTDRAFTAVGAQLHPSITKLGAPGRIALQNFLDPTTVRNNLAAALNGWVVSPDLLSPHGSRGGVVRMRATPVSAELVGTIPAAQLRLHESTATSTGVSTSTKSGFDISAGIGGGATVADKVGGTAGLVGGYSARITETTASGTSSSVRTGIQLKGETGLYKVAMNLEVETPHGPPITVPATSFVRVGLPEAHEAGLPVPAGTPEGLAKPTGSPRFVPPYLAAEMAAGNAKVGQFAPANGVQSQVENALRGLPGFKNFLPSFADPASDPRRAGKNMADLASMAANQRKLATELSPAALKSQMDSLIGPGVQIQLKKQGLATNDFVNITVKARMTNPVHLGQVDNRNVRGSAATGPKLDSSTATQKGWNLGIEGKVVIPKGSGGTKITPTPSAGVKYNSSTSVTTSAGPTVTGTAMNVGSPNAQLFESDVEFDVEITTFSRNRAWVRRLTPGSPFLEVPAPRTVAKTGDAALPLIAGKMNLWVSDSSAMSSDPAVFAPGTPVVNPLPAPTMINQLITRPRPASIPWLHVEAVANTETVRDQAIAALTGAADGDSVLGLPGTESRNRIDKMFSPESIKANLRTLVDKGAHEGGMRYGRRIADRTGAVGMSVALNNPKLVSISDDTGTENAHTGGFTSGASKSSTQSVDVSAGLNAPMRPAARTTGSGAVGVTGKWTPWSKSETKANELGGSVDRNKVTPAGGRTVLVQLDADITVVGESRTGNVVHKGAPNTAGSVVTLPGGVFVRVGEDVARDMGLLPSLPGRSTPEFGTMTPPATLKAGEPGALGLGLVDRVPDLSNLVPQLRTNLGKLGAGLMPRSVLDDSMSTLRRLTDLTSKASVKALMDSALDGGVPLLVHAPGTFGKDSYQVTLKAKLGTPAFDAVVNDGVEMEHTTAGTSKVSEGRGGSTAWGVGLRVPGTGLPRTGDPNLSASAGVMAAANIGQAKSNSNTESTTNQASQSRAGSGPAARYTVPVTFELVVEKGNRVIGRAGSGAPQDMSVRLLADNQRTTTGSRMATNRAFVPFSELRPAVDGLPATARDWQRTGAPSVLPPTASVETLRGAGKLREAAVAALTAAGANSGITGKGTGSMNALWSGLSSETLQPNLPRMLHGALDVPGLREASVLTSQHADVKVYAKMVNPRLVGLSDGVDLVTAGTVGNTTSSDSKQTETADVSLAAVTGSVTSKDPDVGFSAGGIEVRHAAEDSLATSGGAADSKANTLKPQGRTGLVEFDVEYRVVADLGKGRVGVVDLTASGSAQVRMPAPETETILGRPLPTSLETAQTRVKDAAKAWRDAEVAADQVRHTTDETINRLAPDRAAANDAVTAHRGELDAADTNLTTATTEVGTQQGLLDIARQAAVDAQTLADDLSQVRQDNEVRADATVQALLSADMAMENATAEVDDLATRVGDAQTALRAAVDAAQQALDNDQDIQPSPEQPDLAGPPLAAEQARLDDLTAQLADARAKLDQALTDQTAARLLANQAAEAAALARAGHATALTDLEIAQAARDTAAANLRTALDDSRQALELRDRAQQDLDTATRDRQVVEDQIAQAELELERARNDADTQQQLWWQAKTAVDQEVEAFTNPPPPAPPALDATPSAAPEVVPQVVPLPPVVPTQRGRAPERSFDFAPGSTVLNDQQSAEVAAFAADLTEAAAKRADLGYQAPKVEVSGGNAPAVKAALDARLGGVVDVGIAEGGRPNGADVSVDWDLKRPDGHVMPQAPTPARVTDTVITSDRPQVPHPVLSDESWRHSDAPTADWSRPDNPVSSQDIKAARENAPISTVRSEDGGVFTTSTITPDGVDLKAWRGPIAYDKRSFDVNGVQVQDYTVKLYLDPSTTASDAEIDALKARTRGGVDSLFNRGHRLPSGDQLHVTVEFTTDPADAHGHIGVTGPDGRANQLTWPVGADPGRLAHEVGHFLGLQDEYVEPAGAKPVFQHEDGRGRVARDDGPMTARIDSPDSEIKPRNLWLLETRSNALVSPNPQPSPFESTLAPPNAPPPATQPHVTLEQQTMLDLHGVQAVLVDGVDPRSSLINAMAVTVAPNSPDAQQALVANVNDKASSDSTVADLAKAADVRAHVLGADGNFTSHGPVTGVPVHLVETRTADGWVRYHATKETVHIGRPGVSYPGPTKVVAKGAPHTVHRGEFEIETIAGRHHVRIYTAVVNPETIDVTDPDNPKSRFKDIQQDPETGKVNISAGGKGDSLLWAGAGRPQRALQWLAKYEQTDGGQPVDAKNPAVVKHPVLRSFLVPLDVFSKITSEAAVEAAPDPITKTLNVDQRGEPNQFGIGGDHLAELIKKAEPGSLISYASTQSFPLSEEAGRIALTAELRQRLGLDPDFRSDAVGKAYDPWFSWVRQPDGSWKFDGFRNDAHRLHEIATQLREHHVTWQQAKQDPALRKPEALIEPDSESIPNARPGPDAAVNQDESYAARLKRLNQFLNDVGPASVNVGKVTAEVLSTGPGALREYLANNGAPTVDQTVFQQVMNQVVPDAVRAATRKDLDRFIKDVRSSVTESRADLEDLITHGFTPNNKPTRVFAVIVIDRLATQFAAELENHPDLALLTDDSRKRAAEALRGRVKQALVDEFANLASLEPLAKGGKRAGWLSGPRLAEFGNRVAARVATQPAPIIEAAVDPSKLAEVAQDKVLAGVVTGALDGFTGQDLVNTSPDQLKAVVADAVLPTLTDNIAAALREHPSMSLADQAFRDAMADAVALDARVRAEQALAGFTFHAVDPAKVDALMSKVPEIATQAEIGALISADSDRIKLDFNTRTQDGDPFLNSYHQWNSERGQVFEAQRRVGDELSSSINSTGRDAHAVVDQLIDRFPELNRKFDEVTTAPQLEPYRAPGVKDRYTFYEHAQMVLGQYFTLTASENPDARLIPVDALAKAILFHDIEKNNAKNQFGDGKGRHDREPEHKLAVQMMDRYRGLWSNEREFAAARAIVDSDPFGFYLRGKITADEAFSFLHDLADKIGETDAGPARPANARKLFEEFHQYYQADFSSYTTHSGFTDRDGNTRHGPNSFTDRFQPGTSGIQTTPGDRHFEYTKDSDAARKMRELAGMFSDPATTAGHRERIRRAMTPLSTIDVGSSDHATESHPK
jgi:hypothetical protein